MTSHKTISQYRTKNALDILSMKSRHKYYNKYRKRQYKNPLKNYIHTLDTIHECDCYKIWTKFSKEYCKICEDFSTKNKFKRFINDLVLRF